MEDDASVLEANLSYAVSMVRWSFFTPDHAARTCSVPLPTLRAALNEAAVARATYPASAILNARGPL